MHQTKHDYFPVPVYILFQIPALLHIISENIAISYPLTALPLWEKNMYLAAGPDTWYMLPDS